MTENSRLVRVIVAPTLFVVLVVSCSILFLRVGRWYLTTKSSSGEQEAPVVTADSVHVYHSDYRKTSGFDPGSVRVFLRSADNAEIRVKRILIDDIPIPVWGLTNVLTRSVDGGETAERLSHAPSEKSDHSPSHDVSGSYEKARANFGHKRIIWARLSGSTAGPNSVVQFVCKLRAPLARPMRITVLMKDGRQIETVIRPAAQHLAITAITFSENLDKAYCYVENRSEKTCEINAVELDGVSVEGDMWISSRKIAPQAKQVVIIDRAEPFIQGSYHTFYVVSKDGHTIAERVRAFSFFPIAAEWGAPADFGLDMRSALLDRQNIGKEKDPPEQGGPAGKRSNYIFECAMHKFRANLTRSAQEIFSRHDICGEVDPFHPSTLHMCRIRPEEGYAKFGETADILRINPFITTGAASAAKGETPEQIAARLARLAYLGAAPRPVHSLVATHEWRKSRKLGSPAQLRRLVYSILGQGVKGLFYRHRHWSDDNDLNKTIKSLNVELREIREWLVISDVLSVARTDSKGVAVYPLLCPEKGLVLLLVNHAETTTATVQIMLDVPNGWTPHTLMKVAANGLQKIQNVGPHGTVTLNLPAPSSAVAYVLECSRNLQGNLKENDHGRNRISR